MLLHRLTEHCWYTDSDPATDRPSLGYILGNNGRSIVVDAGNSEKHYLDFISCIKKEELPLPELCVITHSHWDHVLGISAVKVPVIANSISQGHLREMCSWDSSQFEAFWSENEFVRAEYLSWNLIHPKTATISFSGKITVDLDGIIVTAEQVVSPHSDDSLLVYVPSDGMIFAGDSSAGDFSLPNIAYVPELLDAYTEKVLGMDFQIFLHSHREPTDRTQTEIFLREAKERGYYVF